MSLSGWVALLTDRTAVAGLALVGAVLSVAGSLGASAARGPSTVAVRLGYGLTGLSVALFILAGFLAGR